MHLTSNKLDGVCRVTICTIQRLYAMLRAWFSWLNKRSRRANSDGGTFASTRGIGITGLPRGKDCWARVRAIGTAGPGPWSDPATILVN